MSESKPVPSKTITDTLRELFRGPVEGVARILIRLRISPDLLTILGLIVMAAAGVSAARGRFVAAGILILLGGPFDALDGTVARMGIGARPFGAMLDSTLDRYAEALLLGGLAYYMSEADNTLGVMLAFASLFGSVMVSYSRARSEGLGIDNKVGLLTRVERLVLILLGLFSGLIIPMLWIVAILTQVTVAQRVWEVYRATSDGGDE